MQKILFVDDEPDVRMFVQHVLTDSGYEVALAEDGEVALEMLESSRPDLILLDVMMPRLDGWGVLEALTELPYPAPPVILLTARDDVASFTRAFRKGVAAFVSKPFRFAELLDTCKRVLEAKPRDVSDDRRAEPRRRLGLGVRVMSDRGIPLALGELLDLSRHGAQVRLDTPREVGSQVWLALYTSSGQTVLQLEGAVRWCTAQSGAHVVGLALGELSTEDRTQLDEILG